MPIHLVPLENQEMNPEGDIFETVEDFDCTLEELRTEVSRVLPGVPEGEISIFLRGHGSQRLVVMRLH